MALRLADYGLAWEHSRAERERRAIVHIIFNTSAAGSLRRAIRNAGRSDEVLHLPDDLSYGPIASIEPNARFEALVSSGPAADREERDFLPGLSKQFWTDCAKASAPHILWMTPRCGQEVAGYLAYISRFSEQPTSVINVDEQASNLPRGDFHLGRILRSGQLWPQHFVSLLDAARHLTPVEMQSAKSMWRRLVRENAMLRVPAAEGGLKSVDENLFDDYILRGFGARWRNGLRILIDVMGFLGEHHGYHVDLQYLVWRLRSLVSTGLLESRPDIRAWSFIRSRNEPEIRRISS